MAITNDITVLAKLASSESVAQINRDLSAIEKGTRPLQLSATITDSSMSKLKSQLNSITGELKSNPFKQWIEEATKSGVGRRIIMLSQTRICPLLSTGDSIRAA